MNGYDRFHSLKTTLFSKETVNPYPDLESLSYEELSAKVDKARDWLNTNTHHPKYDEARRKYNWILHFQMKKQPKDMTPEEVMSYLL